MKVWPKSCPKCAGDLKEETGPYDSYVFCTTCRYTLTHREKEWLLPAVDVAPETPVGPQKQP